jgi:hypothetical protein
MNMHALNTLIGLVILAAVIWAADLPFLIRLVRERRIP